MSKPQNTKSIQGKEKSLVKYIPHMQELGMELTEVGGGVAVMELPYQDRLVGNPDTGVLHGGAVTTLIDSVCGMAVASALDEPCPIATLDLRIDYLRPAAPGKVLVARADCYKVTKQMAFVHGTAYHDSVDDPVATAAGTFILLRG
ncbi:MAG: PaaI family thioesterase, partial [Alphaproteobacteria bacterium]